MAEQPRLSLHDGNSIPQLGLGVWQVPAEITARVVADGIRAGYRSIDTAQGYRNEEGVGEAIRTAGVPREELFITSKLRNGAHDRDAALQSFDESMRKLGIEQLDLFLIHWPLPMHYDGDFVSTWKTLEEFAADGRARSIGVSNFEPAHLDLLAAETSTVPAVNQVEIHPYFGNNDVRRYCAEHGIAVEAWAPIAKGRVADDPVIAGIADRLGRTPAQVTLRWHIQRGDIVLPKSVTPERVRSNIALFDFELSDADMAAISALDKGEAGRMGPHPDKFDMI